MFFRRKKPITHAFGLWIVVGLAGVLLVAGSAYMLALVRLGKPVQVFPARNPVPAAELPSLFGRVISVEGSVIRVDTKQSFDQVVVDEMTKCIGLSGNPMKISDIAPGSLISATGKDIGGGQLRAEAVAVIQGGNGMAPSPTAGLLQAPADWSQWATMPSLIGWGSADSKYLAAVRGYDLKAPAVSVELYGKDGALAARIELDVPGYKHLKPLNDFLTPDKAEAALAADGIGAGASLTSPDGAWRLTVTPRADGTRTVKFTKTQ